MQDKEFTVNEINNFGKAKIVVIGVGGGGQNMVDELVKMGLDSDIKLVAINTDYQALQTSKAPYKLQIGPNITKGLGCGMKPQVGRDAALESKDEIKKMLKDV